METFVKDYLGLEAVATAQLLTRLMLAALEAKRCDVHNVSSSDIQQLAMIINDVLATSTSQREA